MCVLPRPGYPPCHLPELDSAAAGCGKTDEHTSGFLMASSALTTLTPRDVLRDVAKRERACKWAAFWGTAVLRACHWMAAAWDRQVLASMEQSLVMLCDDCLGLVATRSQVSVPLAGTCKRLRPLLLPKLTEMRRSALVALSMLGHC